MNEIKKMSNMTIFVGLPNFMLQFLKITEGEKCLEN